MLIKDVGVTFTWSEGFVDIAEDFVGICIIPVVDDVTHAVHVRLGEGRPWKSHL